MASRASIPLAMNIWWTTLERNWDGGGRSGGLGAGDDRNFQCGFILTAEPM
jgi:hypothetical protein